ncbi:hypothetical protein GXP67_02510 [Rhodocytophaga rosea]|uniref:Uncharacterized protein n=1 Tax=Rhodocytophaga rosea TaxID=2704465 RepID=A0A6C0GCN9_9BACT|nr:hypothetical protein [Rhodocytophaga rosea]QHT65614.1 hypothetical protein GXP67_02510 [Rhodocytophaga rosea]
MLTQRTYSYKDVTMLVACQTIAENFKAHKEEIIAVRSVWADPFISTFETRINKAITSYLGLDPKQELKTATLVVTQLQEASLKDLSFLKVQIEADFSVDKVRQASLLDGLGYYSYWVPARGKNQQALIQLLYQYRNGLTKAVKTELVTKGINEALLNRISSYADTLRKANVTQETLKGSSKEITEAGTLEFNAIYEQAMTICKICSKVFTDNAQVKDKFVFSKIAKSIAPSRKETTVAKSPAVTAE